LDKANHAGRPPVSDLNEHVVGVDPATSESLAGLRLRLRGKRRDPSLRDAVPLKKVMDPADIADSESRPHLELELGGDRLDT
jgi:hypothetical protein